MDVQTLDPSPDMQVVLGGGLWPLAWSAGFVELPLRETYDRYRAWGLEVAFSELGQVPIVDALQRLLPFEMPYTRRLLVRTSGSWTAIFDNSRGGGDPWPPTSQLAREDAHAVIATHIPREQSSLPATQFHLLGPEGEPPLMYVRTIDAGVFDSGRWQFETSGSVLPFERVDAYGPVASETDSRVRCSSTTSVPSESTPMNRASTARPCSYRRTGGAGSSGGATSGVRRWRRRGEND
jgi:hypothetical protein